MLLLLHIIESCAKAGRCHHYRNSPRGNLASRPSSSRRRTRCTADFPLSHTTLPDLVFFSPHVLRVPFCFAEASKPFRRVHRPRLRHACCLLPSGAPRLPLCLLLPTIPLGHQLSYDRAARSSFIARRSRAEDWKAIKTGVEIESPAASDTTVRL